MTIPLFWGQKGEVSIQAEPLMASTQVLGEIEVQNVIFASSFLCSSQMTGEAEVQNVVIFSSPLSCSAVLIGQSTVPRGNALWLAFNF